MTGKTAKLFLFLLGSLGTAGGVAAPPGPNILPNPDMEVVDASGFPSRWKHYAKDRDVASAPDSDAASGRRFIRLVRDSKREAFCRSDLFNLRPGRYRISLRMRGAGKAAVTLSVYHPVRILPVTAVQLADRWQTIAGEVNVPPGVSQASLGISCSRTVDFDAAEVRLIGALQNAAERPRPAVSGPAKTKYRLTTPKLTVEFADMEHGAAVTGIVNADSRRFINFPTGYGLWSIRLKRTQIDRRLPKITAIACDPEMDDSAGSIGRDGEMADDIVIDSVQAAGLGAKFAAEPAADRIVFRWRDIRVGDESGALDVTVTAAVTPEGGIRFDGGFVNRSTRRTVFYFNAPQIDGMGKIHGDGEEDFLATPHYLGRLIRNPASGQLFRSERHFRSNNSGHSMHFDALYSRGEGLLFAVWDPRQVSKRWDLGSSRRHGFSWSCVHLPDNMKCPPPQRWTVPYPVELQAFSGDWYDAAQIYREWAVKQDWCSRGTMTRRAAGDIPKWFLDVTMWLHVSVNDLLNGKKAECDRYFRDFRDHKIAIWLTHWGVDNMRYDFPNPDRFPLTDNDVRALKMIGEAGFPVSGYIQLTAWTRSMPSFKANPGAEANLLRNFYGQILSWGGTGFRRDSMLAYPGQLWTGVLTSFTDRMVRSGFQVAYLDSGNHGGTHLNFTPECTGSCGGGSAYVDGNRKLIQTIRESGRRINPDFCVTTESFWEGNLHCLDAVLCVNSPSAYLEGDRVTAIPLAPAVYNDYALLFATHYGRGDLTGRAQGLIAKTAQALLWGIMPGWELPHAMYKFSDPERVKRTSKQRMEAFDAGRKFFVYGRMLRPPVIKNQIPTLTIPWGIGWSKNVYEVKSPAVIASAFRAPDGAVGIVLYNLDEREHAVAVTPDDRECPMEKRQFAAVYPAGHSVRREGNVLHLQLPAQCPVILEGR
ncbi:MAG: DUF6259 domain-containing protein [Lentisphaeria bacterium]|nr:DUF6259 domain-containing protein [Lentisphaeria bacterium]